MLISTVFMWVAIAAGFVVSLAAGAGPLARGRSKAPPRFNPGHRKTPPAWRAGKYQDAIAAYTQSQKEPQASMRISECQGSLKQHDAAIQTLAGVLNFFKSSAPEAQYRISTHYAAKGEQGCCDPSIESNLRNTPKHQLGRQGTSGSFADHRN